MSRWIDEMMKEGIGLLLNPGNMKCKIEIFNGCRVVSTRVDWLIDWLIDWLVDWLVDWLAHTFAIFARYGFVRWAQKDHWIAQGWSKQRNPGLSSLYEHFAWNNTTDALLALFVTGLNFGSNSQPSDQVSRDPATRSSHAQMLLFRHFKRITEKLYNESQWT